MGGRDGLALAAMTEATQPSDLPRDRCASVVFLTSRLGMGGAERHTISLANALGRQFRVAFAYLKPDEDMIGLLDRNVLRELRCLHASRRIDWRAVAELANMIERNAADVVVCANAFALMYAQLARLRCARRFKVVEVFHTTKLRTLKERLELLFYRPFFWTCDHLVFVCEGQRRYWTSRLLLARRVHMVYNGVDLDHFKPPSTAESAASVRAAIGWSRDDRVVGICAVLRPEKAHSDLIAAVARCHELGSPWRLLIIGDGPMREAIEQDIAAHALNASVHITGFRTDVRELLAACDAVALPSTAIETFSIAALEAMAMGKPMIMSNIGGAPEQVLHGVNGLLFPAGDVAALTQCLQRMWDSAASVRMGAVARARVEGEFSVATMVDRYAALLSEISGRVGDDRSEVVV